MDWSAVKHASPLWESAAVPRNNVDPISRELAIRLANNVHLAHVFFVRGGHLVSAWILH
jgi:hypothetical protein